MQWLTDAAPPTDNTNKMHPMTNPSKEQKNFFILPVRFKFDLRQQTLPR